MIMINDELIFCLHSPLLNLGPGSRLYMVLNDVTDYVDFQEFIGRTWLLSYLRTVFALSAIYSTSTFGW